MANIAGFKKTSQLMAYLAVSFAFISPAWSIDLGGALKQIQQQIKPQTLPQQPQSQTQPAAQPAVPAATQEDRVAVKRTEIVFRDVNEKDIDLIKQNKPLGEWVKKYIKLAKDAGAGEIKTVKGYKISDLIKVAPFSDDATTLLLRAPVIGPGFDDVLVVSRNPISVNRIEHGQESKYFFVTSSVSGKNITTIRYENNGKFRHILDENMTTEVHKTLSDCNLDEDYFKEETYAVMIAEGVLNVNGNKVLSYSTGGAPSLGHSIEIKAPLNMVEKIVRRDPTLERVKFPNFKKIPKTCTAEAKIYEQGRGITMVSCGCNVESGDSDH